LQKKTSFHARKSEIVTVNLLVRQAKNCSNFNRLEKIPKWKNLENSIFQINHTRLERGEKWQKRSRQPVELIYRTVISIGRAINKITEAPRKIYIIAPRENDKIGAYDTVKNQECRHYRDYQSWNIKF
jgi:S-adenosylmethionine:tRNA-ribosyltransferase-isomerase (queuine synthetase)